MMWADGGALRMRVTKNDLWDSRIDTSDDPELPRIVIRTRKRIGGTVACPSWEKWGSSRFSARSR